MAGTVAGGLKAKEKNIKRFGKDYYRDIGSVGGQKSRGGGFAQGEAGRERARRAGSVGGSTSRRAGNKLYEYKGQMMTAFDIGMELGVNANTIRARYARNGNVYARKYTKRPMVIEKPKFSLRSFWSAR